MPKQTIDQLRSSFRGGLIQPTDAAYDSARKVYNGMIDKRPKLIARCVDVADVMAAVQFGRENEMLTAVRGGGHNGGGLGICDDGLVIDLSQMKGDSCRPRRANRPRGRGLRMGRRGPRHPRFRHGHSERNIPQHGCRRPYAGRWYRPPDAHVRPHDRQPARRGPGARRRQLR